MTRKEYVLLKLKQKRAKGITFEDFPTGMRLAARIYDLRKSGHTIVRFWVHGFRRTGEEVKWARYVLVSEANK